MIMEKIYVRDAVREDAPDVARMILLAWPVEEFLKMNPGMTQDDFTCFIRKFVEADDNLYSHCIPRWQFWSRMTGLKESSGR